MNTIQVLSNLRITSQKRKEAELKRTIQKVLEKANCRGGLFDSGDILYLLAKISDAYPGMTAKQQERRVRQLLTKQRSPVRECYISDVRRRAMS